MALAKEFRAALTRREVAIRDFYGLAHAVRALGIDLRDSELVELVRRRLEVPGNEPVDASPDRLAKLRRQMTARLRPVLRQQDFDAFDLHRAFEIMATMGKLMA